jgi:hypothetical protein
LLSVIRRFVRGEPANPFELPRVRYEGGDGSTPATAIVVRGADSDLAGVAATFGWMHMHLGPKDEGWQLITHSTGSIGGRHIDTFNVVLRDATRTRVFFDVSESFGKR